MNKDFPLTRSFAAGFTSVLQPPKDPPSTRKFVSFETLIMINCYYVASVYFSMTCSMGCT